MNVIPGNAGVPGASYDVTLNSAELGLDTCVDLICSLYERKQEGDAQAR